MAVLVPEPRYRTLLRQLGLTTVESLIDLPAVIVGCHPGRQVACVTLGAGPGTVRAFLKRELRVSWQERLRNWWAGFGFVSRSLREGRLLVTLRQGGIDCPEVIAAGACAAGGSFLLLRELTGRVDLRTYLRDHVANDPVRLRWFARTLARTLAELHAAGVDHPDLYSKHVLVDPSTDAVTFLDWQRSRLWSQLSVQQRCRDLAALHATLGEQLVPVSVRLLCLRAYLRASSIPAERWAEFARRIDARARQLVKKRRIRELRQEPLPAGTQDLMPLDQGAVLVMPELCQEMTPEFRALLSYGGFPPGVPNHFEPLLVELPGARRALLTRRRVHRPRGWFGAWLRGRPLLSPERERADALFRLQRYGVGAPRLLAYGQRQEPPWRQESLLLIELPDQAIPLAAWLASCGRAGVRRTVLRDCGQLLRRMHEAGCYLGPQGGADAGLVIERESAEQVQVLLGSVEHLEVHRRQSPELALQNLQWVGKVLTDAGCAPDELLVFHDGYRGLRSRTAARKQAVHQAGQPTGAESDTARSPANHDEARISATTLLTTSYGAEA